MRDGSVATGLTGREGARSGGGSVGVGGLTRRASLLLPLATAGCAWFENAFTEHKKPLPGRRETVIGPTHGLAVTGAPQPVIVPPPEPVADWPQPGGRPDHVGGDPAAGGLDEAWHVSIGAGGGYRRKLTAQPLVWQGRVYTMDSDAVVSAFDSHDGTRIWQTKTRLKHDLSTNVGGGIAIDGGRLYVVTGRADVLALDPANGRVLWRSTLGMPARSAPSVAEGRIYVGTIDDRLLALDTGNGHQLWAYQATPTPLAVLGQPAPAYHDGVVVAGFGSGDLAALRADTGEVVWTDNLGAATAQLGLAELASVRGAPIIEEGLVYAVGLGGLMLAIDLRSGRRVWERDVTSGQDPWSAGDVIFVLNTDQQLAAVSRADGSARWISQMQRYLNMKKSRNPITWAGPILAGGKLVLVNDKRQAALVDPADGKLLKEVKLSAAGSLAPIAASGMIFILTDDGRLTAFR